MRPRIAFAMILSLSLLAAAPGPGAIAQSGSDAPAAAAPASPTAPGRAPSDPRAHLEEILTRFPYQRWQRRQDRAKGLAVNPEETEFGTRFAKALKDMLDSFFSWLRSVMPTTNPFPKNGMNFDFASLASILQLIGWIAVALGLVAMVIFAVRTWRSGAPGASSARVLSREQVRRALETGEALALDSPQWLSEADRLANETDPRLVYRALYLALLSGLHTAGKIDFRRNRTNWVYVTRYRGSEGEKSIFSRLTDDFDRLWYGLEPAHREQIDSLRSAVVKLVSQER